MEIRCECGRFRAQLQNFPRNTAGHLACYCDDCQTYLQALGRADLLDPAGGTVVVPVYPADVKILAGRDALKCTRLSPKGIFRFSTTCCNTPIANARPGFPWAGLIHRVFTVHDPRAIEEALGPLKSAIYGKYARGTPAPVTSQTMRLRDVAAVAPFLLKGFLLGRARPSPFFDGEQPVVPPRTLTLEERNAIRRELGFGPIA